MKNFKNKKRKESSHNKKNESLSNSFLNNSQLFKNNNNYMKIFDRLEIYKKIFNKKMRNLSKKKKDKFNSNKNKSATILTVRDKKSFHSHSLENDYHTTRPKNTKNSLKTLRNFSLKMVNSKKLNKTKNIKNKNDIIRNKILGKNKEIISIQQILNRTKYKKNSRHGNKNNIPRNDNDNSLKYLLFRRIGKSNSANKKSSKTRKSYSRIKV